MSRRTRKSVAVERKGHAVMFAALGDKTRLSLVAKLSGGQPRSIAHLTEGTRLTRQAITKHLRVLEKVEIVRSVRTGRESLFELDLEPIEDLKKYLELISQQWDFSLSRLKAFVEK